MRERIARAFALHWTGDDNAIQTAGPAKTQGKPVWMCYLEHADIALAAMEIPTTEMVDAAPCIVGENPGPSEVWSAMIKEARKP